MSTIAELIAQHDAEDVAREQRITELDGLLAEYKKKLFDALSADEEEDNEYEALIEKLNAQVATLTKLLEERPEPAPLPPEAQFPGDPGPGKYMVGIALGPNGNSTIAAAKLNPAWNSKTKVVHDYAARGAKCLDHNRIKAVFDNKLPVASQSFKMSGVPGATLAEKFDYISSGKNDAEIRLSAKFCKTFAEAIWLCFYHEPEDVKDYEKYRAAYRQVVKIFREEGVTNVAFMPIYMCPWTFKGSGYDFRNWHADWDGTKWHTDQMMDMMGLDTYSPLPGSTNYRSYTEMKTTARTELKAKGFNTEGMVEYDPEFGMGRAVNADWMKFGRETRTEAETGHQAAICYWDNSDDIGRYSLGSKTGNNDGDKKKAAWDHIVEGAI